MQKRNDDYLSQAVSYVKTCGYENKLKYSHYSKGCRVYRILPLPNEGLTGYPLVVKVYDKGETTIDIDDNYKF